MKIKAFSTLGEISHFAISGYFVISGFDITGHTIYIYIIKFRLLCVCVCVFVCLFVCPDSNYITMCYNEGSMNGFRVEINFDIVVIYKLKYWVNGNRICQ